MRRLMYATTMVAAVLLSGWNSGISSAQTISKTTNVSPKKDAGIMLTPSMVQMETRG